VRREHPPLEHISARTALIGRRHGSRYRLIRTRGPYGTSPDRHLPVCGGAAGSLTVTQSPQRPGGKGEGSVVCLGDAFDDCQAEADTCVVGAYAFGAALKRLGKRGN
jgi:hypothetical protein